MNWRALRRPPLVLLYHRIAELAHDPWGIAVTPERFEKQLRFLKLFFRPVPLMTLLETARTGRASGMVSLTFDDGYADLVEAERLLAKHRVPATLFLSSGPIVDGTGFWWDMIDDRALWKELKNLPDAERRKRFSSAHLSNVLTSDQARQLSRSPWITIGAHGRSHSSLAALDRATQEYEVRESRRELEAITGKPVALFSYPFGNREDFSATTAEVVRAAGYAYACSGATATVRSDFDAYDVPRCEIVDEGVVPFSRRLAHYLSKR